MLGMGWRGVERQAVFHVTQQAVPFFLESPH
jgi:hypothetical protein